MAKGKNKNSPTNKVKKVYTYVTSQDCEKCLDKCPNGKRHLTKLQASGKSNCPACYKN